MKVSEIIELFSDSRITETYKTIKVKRNQEIRTRCNV